MTLIPLMPKWGGGGQEVRVVGVKGLEPLFFGAEDVEGVGGSQEEVAGQGFKSGDAAFPELSCQREKSPISVLG
jgi:hypothetical protein